MDDLSAPTGREPEFSAAARADGTAPLAVVFGGTGYIGGRLVPRLIAAGYRVRVLARDLSRISSFSWGSGVEGVAGDATDPEAVAKAVEGADVLYYLVHSMSAGKGFEDADRRAAETVAKAAAAASVGRIVYLGGLHPDGVALSPHLRSRVDVGEVFLASGVPTLVLQAGVVIGSGSASFEMVRHLTDVLPYMPAPKWVRNRIQPIAVRDVLYYLLGAARVAPDVNRAVDIGGPDVLRYGQMMNAYALEAGLPQRPIAALPVLTPRLASLWVNLVTPIPQAIARPLVESLQNECVMKDHDIDSAHPAARGADSRPTGGPWPSRSGGFATTRSRPAGWMPRCWESRAIRCRAIPTGLGRTVFVDTRTASTSASPDRLWRVIEGIGGENGWYSSPLLWAIRGWMDRLVGGIGLARGRRSRARLEVGDALDFWRVEAIERGSFLRLRAEMKVPGLAWLELRSSAEGDGSRYDQRAVFFPQGLTGRLYWLAVLPFHGFIFRGMANRIAATAQAEAVEQGLAPQT